MNRFNLLSFEQALSSLLSIPSSPEDVGVAETKRRLVAFAEPDAEFVQVVVDIPAGQFEQIRRQVDAGRNVAIGENPDDDDDYRSLHPEAPLPVFVDVNGHGYVRIGQVETEQQIAAMRSRLDDFAKKLVRGGIGAAHYPLIALSDGKGLYCVELQRRSKLG